MTTATLTVTSTETDEDGDVEVETDRITSVGPVATADAVTTTGDPTDAAAAESSAEEQSGNFAPAVTAAPMLAMGVAAVALGL